MPSEVFMLLLVLSNALHAATWEQDVAARLNDARFAPATGAFGWELRSPQRGLTAHVHADGVRLEHGPFALSVRTAAWGRRGDALPTSGGDPVLGRCITGRAEPSGQCVRRVERELTGLTEWWLASEDGVQQGWSVGTAPAGEGPVVLELWVEGDVFELEPDELWLQGDDGELWLVGGLAAWDADGRLLPVAFALGPAGVEIVVDDAGARYPIEIDPVYTAPSASLYGTGDYDVFGSAVAGGADLDGDGYDDVVVSAPWYGADAGRVYVYHGSAGGLDDIADLTLTGSAGQNLGVTLAAAGDVNRDGFDDLVVGSFDGVYVHHGSLSGLSALAVTALPLADNGSGAGDVNGDGYADVIVGAPAVGSGVGQAFLHLGSAAGISAEAGTTIQGEAGDYFGSEAQAAGDVNGDGYADVIFGASGHAGWTGRASVYHGSAAGLGATAATVMVGESEGDAFGSAAVGVGDVNRDGFDDVVIGARNATAVYVFEGSPTGLSPTATLKLAPWGIVSFGYRAVGAGDVDCDGFDDVLIAAPSAGEGNSGLVYVFAGAASGLAEEGALILAGGPDDGEFGEALSTAGDVNGDGFDDIVIGAYAYQPDMEEWWGAAYLFLGRGFAEEQCDRDGDGAVATEDCDDEDATIHPDAEEIPDDDIDQDCDGSDAEGDTSSDTSGDTPGDTGGEPDVVPDDWSPPSESPSGECGCSTGGGAVPALWVGLLAVGAVRRGRATPRGRTGTR